MFPELRADQPTLAGKPVDELSNMDATLGGGAGNDPVLLYEDFSNFVVSQPDRQRCGTDPALARPQPAAHRSAGDVHVSPLRQRFGQLRCFPDAGGLTSFALQLFVAIYVPALRLTNLTMRSCSNDICRGTVMHWAVSGVALALWVHIFCCQIP